MDISPASRDILIKEIEFVTQKMDESSYPEEKLYYFSAIYSMFQRILNIDFDPDLLFAFFVLRETYNAFMSRLSASDRIVKLSDYHFAKLLDLSRTLLERLRDEKDFNDVLKQFVLLLYTTTGNGYYLVQKGLIEV